MMPRLLMGALVIVLGGLLLLSNLHLVDAETFLRFWPLLLVALGLNMIFGRRVGCCCGCRSGAANT
jgi:hypothetical protein